MVIFSIKLTFSINLLENYKIKKIIKTNISKKIYLKNFKICKIKKKYQAFKKFRKLKKFLKISQNLKINFSKFQNFS